MKNIEQTDNISEAEQIDVPEGIINFLQKRTGMITPAVKSRYWVSDIVGCQRKTYYKRLGIEEEELLKDATLEGMWDSVRGDLLHQMTYAYRWRELDMENYILLKDGRTVVVVGRLDMYDWRTKTIIDLKTTKLIKWQIKQGFISRLEHILQIQCYDTMFSQILPIETLNIVYADMSEIVTFKIQRRDLKKWIRTRIQEIEDFVSGNNIPIGEVSGVCKYCKYQTYCCNDGGGLTENPLSVPKFRFD
jgi:CRISPR/Cas system-associated exonuclease Cas4 (RecB family)